jgi:hypothetical protein
VDFLVVRRGCWQGFIKPCHHHLSALALGAHLSAGEIGRELRDERRGWLNKSFGLVAAEARFCSYRWRAHVVT